MIYTTAVQQPQQVSLSDDLIRLNADLIDILNRVVQLGDKLHGSVPRDATKGTAEPPPPNAIRRYIDGTLSTAAKIQEELCRVEIGL